MIHAPASEQRGHLRVVDESGEDYLYPEEFFAVVEVPFRVALIPDLDICLE